jgi:hypothetical protein
MIRLQKHSSLDRLSPNEREYMVKEINASERLCKLLSGILEERVDYYDSRLESLLEKPSELAGAIQCKAELKRLLSLFSPTTNE